MDRRRVSHSNVNSWSSARAGWMPKRSRMPTLRAACCPGRRRHSWRSSAPTRSGVPAGRSSAGWAFFTPAVILILILSVLFLAQSPPCGSEAPGREPGPAGAAVAGSHCPRAVRSERRSCSTRRRPHRAMAVISRRGSRRRRVAGRVRGTRTAQLRTDRAVVLRRRSDLAASGRGSSFVLLLPASIASGGFGALAWRLSRPLPPVHHAAVGAPQIVLTGIRVTYSIVDAAGACPCLQPSEQR